MLTSEHYYYYWRRGYCSARKACTYACFNGCPLWLCPWKETASTLGQGERSFKEVLLSRSQHSIGCHAANFALGHQGWAEKPWRGIPGPFQACLQLILPGIEPATPQITNRQNHQILSQKDPLQTVGLLLCLEHWCRRRKYYICPAPLHLHSIYPSKLGCHTIAVQGTLWPNLH